jgi:hypothetical protein
MCDVSEKLVAWLDRELPGNEVADIERHVKTCAECRLRLDAYKNVDRVLESYCNAYCEPALASVAATVALLLILQHGKRIEGVQPHAPGLSAAAVPETPPMPSRWNGPAISNAAGRKPIGRRPTPFTQHHAVNWAAAEPTIEIAIPASAMFAPGAVPEGVSLTAEVTVAPDGTAQRLHLRP